MAIANGSKLTKADAGKTTKSEKLTKADAGKTVKKAVTKKAKPKK